MHKFEIKPGSWVFVPDRDTIERGHEIRNLIHSLWTPPYYYAHFKKGGHVAALKRHVANNLFIRADIKKFFNQVNRTKITRVLSKLLSDYSLAREIACESTVVEPDSKPKAFILPFGFVQSPIIASLCLHKSRLGKYLDKLEGKGFRVSVYMDDIIISTSQSVEVAEEVFDDLKSKAILSKFELNPDKSIGPTGEISAFNINLSPGKLEITENRMSDFEKQLKDAESEYVINGVLGYIYTINTDQASGLS